MEQQQLGRKQYAAGAISPDVAQASVIFDQFCNASTLKSILGHYRQLCELLKIRPNTINQFYPKLKGKLRSWKAQALWKKFDQRANHKCYNRGKACPGTRLLIIGGGPCGLRSAIEAQLLGAKVVVVEKRDRMSRNNVLHLWPFVIHDLRGLGAKKFFGKFCAGSIDHISIRQLQCILLKVALILGVEFHESVSFDALIPPPENQEDGKIGWRAKTTPVDHPVSQYEFDVLIGADGKRNTLEGFKRKEFRGKLAIAITANFINKRTEAEARVEEISGVAFIFNQKFFKELYQETGIDLENIVYYKDDTHYFVMTAKKHSLIDKGVILQDHADTAKLLAKENVDREALMRYAREAAEFSTEYQMMDMEFAVNHYGQPDVAMFDFTSMYAAENASRVLERHGHRLLMILVGDSLLEPFWPTGSGCARGFLSSLDACWAIKGWGSCTMSPLEVIAERESIYRLLGQTTPENLNRDYAAYTLDPHTRYPNLNASCVTPIQVRGLLNTDDPESYKQSALQTDLDIPKKRRRRDLRSDTQVHPDTLLRWLQKQVALYDTVHIEDMGTSFKDGLALCAIIHRYRPDLIDFYSLQADDAVQNNQLAFDVLEKELGIPPIMTGPEMADCDVPDKLAMFSYLTQVYEAFRGEIPHVRQPTLDLDNEDVPVYGGKQLNQLTPDQKAQLLGRVVRPDNTAPRTRHSRSRYNENILVDKKGDTISRRSRKRRSTEKMGATVEERQKKLAEIEKNRADRMRRRQYLRKMATQQFYKSMQMLQANAKREKDEPFEDYSIFLYRQTAPDFKDRVKYLEQKILYPDREPKMPAGHRRSSIDEEFSGRIKNIEDKLKGSAPSEKKPRDLLRAIGKIEKTDWNVKEIEKKIEENKMGRSVKHEKVERVPKWSREQFLARQTKMEKKGRDQKEADSKYADIDNTLKNIDRKIKEGNVLGYNKVSAMAEQFSNKGQDAEPKLQKSNVAKPTVTLPAQGGSEVCHFCNKRVYLMERLSAEGKFFHRGCFRCEYCSTSLRIGNHAFDREKSGGRFYCSQHFGLSGTMKARAEKKRLTTFNKENIPAPSANVKTWEKTKAALEGVAGLDLLDRGQTPERIEFENLAGVSDAEEAQSQMDEDEWTDRNFGASTAEMGSSDDISDMTDSDEDNEVYEEAMDQPLTTEGTLELAKNWTLRYSHSHAAAAQSDTGSNEYEDSSDEYTSEDDESETATEDEDDIRARELRKQEVWLENPTRASDTDTGSETEVKSSQDCFLDKVIQEPPGTLESVTTQHSDSHVSPMISDFGVDTAVHDEGVMNRDGHASALNETSSDSDPALCKHRPMAFTIGKLENETTDSLSQEIKASGSIIPSDTRPPCDANSAPLSVIDSSKSPFAAANNSNEHIVVKNANQIPNATEPEENTCTAVILYTGGTYTKIFGLTEQLQTEDSCKRLTTADNSDAAIMLLDATTPDRIEQPSSRSSTPASSSSSYESIELHDELATIDNSEQSSVINPRFNNAAGEGHNITNENCLERIDASGNSTTTVKGCVLMLDLKTCTETCPIVTITSPSPTTEEMCSEEMVIETTKLTVPEEAAVSRQIEPAETSSFDRLKSDLRQRKARNRLNQGELKPLSTETARKKIGKYFTQPQKIQTVNQTVQRAKTPLPISAEREELTQGGEAKVEQVELNLKPKLSSKIQIQDITKYFIKQNSQSSQHAKKKVIEANINENDVNIINQLFDQIKQETDCMTVCDYTIDGPTNNLLCLEHLTIDQGQSKVKCENEDTLPVIAPIPPVRCKTNVRRETPNENGLNNLNGPNEVSLETNLSDKLTKVKVVEKNVAMVENIRPKKPDRKRDLTHEPSSKISDSSVPSRGKLANTNVVAKPQPAVSDGLQKSVASIERNTFVRDSAKEEPVPIGKSNAKIVSPKADRSKKDKCVIS